MPRCVVIASVATCGDPSQLPCAADVQDSGMNAHCNNPSIIVAATAAVEGSHTAIVIIVSNAPLTTTRGEIYARAPL